MKASGLRKFPDVVQLSKFYVFIKDALQSYLLRAAFPNCSTAPGFPSFLHSGHRFTPFYHVQCSVGLPLIHHQCQAPRTGTVASHGFEPPWCPGLDAKIPLVKNVTHCKKERQFIFSLHHQIPSTLQDVA